MKQKIVLSNELRVDKGSLWQKAMLTLEALAFWIFHGGNSTFMNSFDKQNLCFIHSSTDVVPQFLEKLEIYFDETFSSLDHVSKIGGRNSIHRALNEYF